MVSLLVSSGASLSLGDLVNFTGLHYAVWWGRDTIVQYLLTSGSDVNCVSCVGDTPLHLAAWKGHLRICTMLMEKGGSVNAKGLYLYDVFLDNLNFGQTL